MTFPDFEAKQIGTYIIFKICLPSDVDVEKIAKENFLITVHDSICGLDKVLKSGFEFVAQLIDQTLSQRTC